VPGIQRQVVRRNGRPCQLHPHPPPETPVRPWPPRDFSIACRSPTSCFASPMNCIVDPQGSLACCGATVAHPDKEKRKTQEDARREGLQIDNPNLPVFPSSCSFLSPLRSRRPDRRSKSARSRSSPQKRATGSSPRAHQDAIAQSEKHPASSTREIEIVMLADKRVGIEDTRPSAKRPTNGHTSQCGAR